MRILFIFLVSAFFLINLSHAGNDLTTSQLSTLRTAITDPQQTSAEDYPKGEHDLKRFEKHTMWKESIKAPFIAEAAGLEPMPEPRGKSFLDLPRGNDNSEHEFVFAGFLEDNKAMAATHRWTYIFTTGKRDFGRAIKPETVRPGFTIVCTIWTTIPARPPIWRTRTNTTMWLQI